MAGSRREFIKGMALTTALLAGGGLRPGRLLAHGASAAGNPLRFPPELTDGALTAAPGSVPLWDGAATNLYTANGEYLSPLVRRQTGDEFAVTLRNRLSNEDLIVHWHGLIVPEEMDGHPRHAVPPGEDYSYAFQVQQRAATYWYHPHTDMLTGKQVYMGLAGLFIVHDEEEQGLGLPTGEFDLPLVIQDRRVVDNQFVYEPVVPDILNGYMGETPLVNGTPGAYLSVAPTLYRFRLLNGSNARVYRIALEDESSFHLIGADQGLLEAPIEVSSFYLAPGQRTEILVDFSRYQSGASINLKSLPFDRDGMMGSRQGMEMDLLRFDVDREGSSGASVPSLLSSIDPLNPAEAVRIRDFRLHMLQQDHAINNLTFGMDRIDFDVPMGDVEIWEFDNPSLFFHPMHVHGVRFQVIERNGSADLLLPEERGWKDTVLLFPRDKVKVALRFEDYTGVFLLHCHNLEHEDHGMMMNFRVTGPSGVDDPKSGGPLRLTPNPAFDRTMLRCAAARQDRTVSIIDAGGRVVYRDVVASGRSSLPLNVSGLPSGRYFCRMGNEAVPLSVVR